MELSCLENNPIPASPCAPTHSLPLISVFSVLLSLKQVWVYLEFCLEEVGSGVFFIVVFVVGWLVRGVFVCWLVWVLLVLVF